MARWHYTYAGLNVTSELCLPEWGPFENEQPAQAPDVEIRLEGSSTEVDMRRLTAGEFRFHVKDIGHYWVEDGRLIRIAMHPSAGERETRLFLLGSAWGALCYQRGLLALHASVVEVDGKAVAFCGVSGAGKSSVAAWLVAHGYPLIGDDLCHFDLSESKPRIYPAAPRLKLWRDVLEELGWGVDGLERDHFRMDKFHVSSNAEQGLLRQHVGASEADFPLPLCAIYLLAWGETQITRLTGLAALYQLVESATYRGEYLEPMGALAAHWQRCATLARKVPIYRFTRPAEWHTMNTTMQALIGSWQKEATP